VVTANRGSCDLTLVDPATLLAPIVKPTPRTSHAHVASTTVVP